MCYLLLITKNYDNQETLERSVHDGLCAIGVYLAVWQSKGWPMMMDDDSRLSIGNILSTLEI